MLSVKGNPKFKNMQLYLSGILKFALVNIYMDMPNKLWYYVFNMLAVLNFIFYR